MLDMVRSMMGFVGLPISLWGYALESACYLLNRVPSKSVTKMRYEIWIGRKPILSHLRVWGCPTYVKRLITDKLGSRSDKCNFIRYPKETKGYYFYLADEQKVFVRLKAIFLKKEFLDEGTVASKVKLEEVQQVEKLTQVAEPELDLVRSDPEPIVPAPSR